VVAALVFLLATSWAALAADASSTSPAKTNEGFEFSIMEGTQGNFGKLSIGAGYMGGGPYLDEENVRRDGLHASLSITVEGQSSKFQQPDVHEGQILGVAGYRILVEKIVPNAERGTIIVRIWAP
jgi:hypothetical protein